MSEWAVTKILVPVDFSECSRRGLERALRLAEAFGAAVTVLHAWQIPVYAAPELMVGPTEGEALPDHVRRQARRALDDLLRVTPRPPALRLSIALEVGEPTQVILAGVEAGGYDLVVMGTHGRTGLDRLVMGSIAEKVVRRASCPVLTVRVPEGGTAFASAHRP